MLDVIGLIVIDRLRPVVPDPMRLVVLDLDVLVLLGVNPKLLGALLSSKRMAFAFAALPPLLDRVRMPDCVAFAGSSHGGICAAL